MCLRAEQNPRGKGELWLQAAPRGSENRTLPQHKLFDLPSERARAAAPYRLSSDGNLRSRAGHLGPGQGGRVLHAESFPDAPFPYSTWQPPTDRLPETGCSRKRMRCLSPSRLFTPPSSFSPVKRYSSQPHRSGPGGSPALQRPRGPRKGPAYVAPASAAPAPLSAWGGRAPKPFAGHEGRCQHLASPAAEPLSGPARPSLWHAAGRACGLGVRAPTTFTSTPGSLDANQEPQSCLCREHQSGVS